ncbi:autophagy protein 17 [Trapelia coarctata]|nr:autophagy protein 17 [Trapelia coarctata]
MASSTSSLPPEQHDSASPPSLELLVAHLLAAKRSLSCVEQVYRANDLVIQTRQALEDQTKLIARTVFLHNGSHAQVQLLGHVLSHIRNIAREGESDFKSVLQVLDLSESRLRQTLQQLRATVIEPSLRPVDEPSKSLVDFVDESGVEGLLGTIKESIDATVAARQTFKKSNKSFEDEIAHVRSLLEPEDGQRGNGELSSGLRSPIPDILQGMEEHAQEMADNLESLVKHFDVCVTAIKHTEGGGAAAQNIATDLPEGVSLGLTNEDEPLSEEERMEMLAVLEKDASEVEEVVIEIKDRSTEMEAYFERSVAHSDLLSESHAREIAAYKLLEEVGAKLPTYILQSQIFLAKWEDEKVKIEERMEELETVRDFYDGFLRAYDKLIIEIGRRKTMETKVAKVAQEAMAKIDRLYAEDVADRDSFRQEQGDFLPVDIWPGLMLPPKRYKVCQEDENASSVPDISASVIQRAIRRVSGRQ